MEFKKKNCPLKKQKATKIRTRNCVKLGTIKTIGKKIDVINAAMKLFNNKILKIFSL